MLHLFTIKILTTYVEVGRSAAERTPEGAAAVAWPSALLLRRPSMKLWTCVGPFGLLDG